jgi:hypothetical protein
MSESKLGEPYLLVPATKRSPGNPKGHYDSVQVALTHSGLRAMFLKSVRDLSTRQLFEFDTPGIACYYVVQLDIERLRFGIVASKAGLRELAVLLKGQRQRRR